MLLTNYKHTQPTLGLSVTFVFNIEYIYIPLEIETGRYYGITREQRICKQCNLNVIENEQHFYLIALNI